MYEERKEKFSFKSFFLTLLLVLLFVFLMLWLFPTRSYVDQKLQSTYDLERLSVLYDEIFANNVGRMKDAAIGYYTNERMPHVVGQSKKMTLGEMYDLHLVLKMKDKDGKPCNTEKSYVEMTKYTEEYRLKVNLSCGKQEDYIIVYLGCYNYCPDGICEKHVSTPSTTTKKEETFYNPDPTPTPTPDPTPTPTPVVKNYMYEYKLIVEDCTTCAGWTEWKKDAITATDLVKVETKTEREISGYKDVSIQTGVKTENVVTTTQEKYISGYTTILEVVGTKQIQVGTTTKTTTKEVKVGTVEKYSGIETSTSVPSNTSTTIYKVVSTDTPVACSYCENETKYTYEIYKIEPVYEVKDVTEEVPVYRNIKQYEEKQVPVYDYKDVQHTNKVTTPIYETVKVPEYANVTYYRSKTCTIKKGYSDIKWSYNKFDSNLIGSGYKLTGNVKQV